MAVGDAHVFPGFLIPVLTQLSFPSHRLLFSSTSEVRGENTPKSKFASQPTGHESDTLTTELPPRAVIVLLSCFSRFDPASRWLAISVYLSSLPVAHLSDAPRRRLVVTGDSARIQDETTESSTLVFNVLGV